VQHELLELEDGKADVRTVTPPARGIRDVVARGSRRHLRVGPFLLTFDHQAYASRAHLRRDDDHAMPAARADEIAKRFRFVHSAVVRPCKDRNGVCGHAKTRDKTAGEIGSIRIGNRAGKSQLAAVSQLAPQHECRCVATSVQVVRLEGPFGECPGKYEDHVGSPGWTFSVQEAGSRWQDRWDSAHTGEAKRTAAGQPGAWQTQAERHSAEKKVRTDRFCRPV
jgi:hypothetical protein